MAATKNLDIWYRIHHRGHFVGFMRVREARVAFFRNIDALGSRRWLPAQCPVAYDEKYKLSGPPLGLGPPGVQGRKKQNPYEKDPHTPSIG